MSDDHIRMIAATLRATFGPRKRRMLFRDLLADVAADYTAVLDQLEPSERVDDLRARLADLTEATKAYAAEPATNQKVA